MQSQRLRWAGFLTLLIFGLSGCSYSDVLIVVQPPEATAPPASTLVIVTPSSTGTVTPTQPTPSFTPTPTLVYLETSPAINAPAGTLVNAVGTPVRFITPTSVRDAVFTNISLAGKQIFWGSCGPASTLLTASVDESMHVESVTLALRLENPKTNDTTQWGGYALMDPQRDGTFTYRLKPESFSHYRDFLSAWGQFQLIAIGRNEEVIGRSEQFLRLLAIAPCP